MSMPENDGALSQDPFSEDLNQTSTPSSEADLAAHIASLEAEIARLKDEKLRALAEAENIRRRVLREKEDMGKFAIQAFAKDLLPVADNLRRAIGHVSAQGAQQEEVKTLLTGVEMTEKELLGVFTRHGVVEVAALESIFDPNLHQAMIEIEQTGKAPGTIVQLFQAGYSLNGRLLRPALVGVAKGEIPAHHLDTNA
jgi:molecular chaperone GrpE